MIHRTVLPDRTGHQADSPQALDFRRGNRQLIVQRHIGNHDRRFAGTETVGDVEVGGKPVAGIEFRPGLKGFNRNLAVQVGGDAAVPVELPARLKDEHSVSRHAHADICTDTGAGIHQEGHVFLLQNRQVFDHIVPCPGIFQRGRRDTQFGKDVRTVEHHRIGLLLRQTVYPAVKGKRR